MAIIDVSHCDQIRAAILADLADQDLPNDIIAMDIYMGRANAEIVERDADAESRTGADGSRVLRAAIYLCAAYLCPTVERKMRVQVTQRDVSYSRSGFDARARAAELRGMADDEMSQVLTGASPERFTMFGRASGTRGR